MAGPVLQVAEGSRQRTAVALGDIAAWGQGNSDAARPTVAHLPFGHSGEARPNALRFGLDPESLTLELTGTGPRARSLVPLTLTAPLESPELPAYGRLLLDVLTGNAALSIRGDEAEAAWRVLTPVLAAWEKGLVPLLEYPAGSDGPVGIDCHRGVV